MAGIFFGPEKISSWKGLNWYQRFSQKNQIFSTTKSLENFKKLCFFVVEKICFFLENLLTNKFTIFVFFVFFLTIDNFKTSDFSEFSQLAQALKKNLLDRFHFFLKRYGSNSFISAILVAYHTFRVTYADHPLRDFCKNDQVRTWSGSVRCQSVSQWNSIKFYPEIQYDVNTDTIRRYQISSPL